MATRRGFLRKILSAGAAVPLAALPHPKADSPEVAQLKQMIADLEARQASMPPPSDSGYALKLLHDLDTLSTIRQNWLMQTTYPRPLEGPQPPATEIPEALRWEPGKMLEMSGRRPDFIMGGLPFYLKPEKVRLPKPKRPLSALPPRTPSA